MYVWLWDAASPHGVSRLQCVFEHGDSRECWIVLTPCKAVVDATSSPVRARLVLAIPLSASQAAGERLKRACRCAHWNLIHHDACGEVESLLVCLHLQLATAREHEMPSRRVKYATKYEEGYKGGGGGYWCIGGDISLRIPGES